MSVPSSLSPSRVMAMLLAFRLPSARVKPLSSVSSVPRTAAVTVKERVVFGFSSAAFSPASSFGSSAEPSTAFSSVSSASAASAAAAASSAALAAGVIAGRFTDGYSIESSLFGSIYGVSNAYLIGVIALSAAILIVFT
ncbi:MAG: hypothetical protein IJP64_06630, partial [Oscillospiraceae bacterium]|nr:hypothetical protein [Oscillospiraceae bacterium]